jgi:hypothetical protein
MAPLQTNNALCWHAGLLAGRRWRAALVAYSAAVSVKMNVLLMAPPVLVVMLKVGSALPRISL